MLGAPCGHLPALDTHTDPENDEGLCSCLQVCMCKHGTFVTHVLKGYQGLRLEAHLKARLYKLALRL